MYILILILAFIQILTLKDYLLANNFMLIFDGINQYTHFYSGFSEALKNFKSLFWNWNQGIGSNFFGTMTYYVLSPVMLILVLLFPTDSVPYLFVIAFIIKQQLAAVFMFKLLRKYDLSKINSIIIGLLWACNAYFIHYADNPMWLDALYLLPLIFIGIERIMEKNKFGLFVICIALAAITNYYLFFSLTIFTYMYIIIRYIIKNEKFVFKDAFLYFIKITGYYLIGVLIAAFVLIPSVVAIKESSRAASSGLPNPFTFSFGLVFESLKNAFFNTSHNFYVGYNTEALIYSGNICVLLLPLLLLPNKAINMKVRVLSILVLVLEVLSIGNMFVYLGFHGFTPPVCFPFRYMYGFIAFNLLMVAYLLENIIKGKIKLKLWYLMLVSLASGIILIKQAPVVIIINIIVLIVYYVLMNYKKSKWLLALIAIEVLISTGMIVNKYLPIALSNETSQELFYNDELESLINDTKSENSLERVFENFSLQKSEPLRNLALTYGYPGLNSFTSTDNKYYMEFLEELKLKDNSMGMVNLTGNLFSNQILNVKYSILLNDWPVPYGYELIKKMNNYSLYENTNYLNGGYVNNNYIKESTFKELSLIEKELVLINNIIVPDDSELDENYEVKIPYSKVDYNNFTSNLGEVLNNTVNTTGIENPYIEFTLDNLNYVNNEVFLHYEANNKIASIEITSGDNTYIIESGAFTDQNRLFDFGVQNNPLKVKINLLNDTEYEIRTLDLYTVDLDEYSKQLEEMKSNSFNELKASSNKVTGNIDVKEEGTVFMSVPYSSGWKLYVNGVETEYTRVNKTFIGVELAKGNYDIEMRYVTGGFKIGAIMSSIGVLMFIGVYFINRKKRSSY